MKIFGKSFREAGGNLYVTDDKLSFTYSDGDENERRLLEVTKSARDLSSLSLELHQNDQSWIDRYHFSMHRGSIVRCLPLSRPTRVLEIGAGCGAVTRALAEKFTQVDAIEGSLNRARICSSRCRDLENVRVFVSEINRITPEPNYDLVLLVGVLEWSSGFVEGIHPFRKCLQIASNALVEDGTIVIAIENQLGLKYFLGSGEDHCGKEFEGLHGYPTFHLAETFSKLRLSEMLKASGLIALRFMYPFPDYKMARVVITDEAVSLCSESVGYWVSRYPFEDYLQPKRRILGNRGLIACEIAKAGLLGELANSFLILASRRESALPKQSWMVWSERLARRPAFCSVTTLENTNGSLEVRKTYPYDSPEKRSCSISTFGLNPQVIQPFFPRVKMLELELLRYSMAGNSPRFLNGLRDWMKYVERNYDLDDQYVQSEAWDCIPRNLARLEDKTLAAFDLEFRSDNPVRKEELCARGLLWWYLENGAWATPLNPDAKNIGDHLKATLATLFQHVDANRLLAVTLEHENRFQESLNLVTNPTDLRCVLSAPHRDISLAQSPLDLAVQLQDTQNHLNRLRNHPVIGTAISLWRTFFNRTLP